MRFTPVISCHKYGLEHPFLLAPASAACFCNQANGIGFGNDDSELEGYWFPLLARYGVAAAVWKLGNEVDEPHFLWLAKMILRLGNPDCCVIEILYLRITDLGGTLQFILIGLCRSRFIDDGDEKRKKVKFRAWKPHIKNIFSKFSTWIIS